MLSGSLGLSPTVGVRPGGGGWYVGTYLPNVIGGMIKGLPSILTPQPTIRIMHLNLYKAPCQNASTNCLQLTNGCIPESSFIICLELGIAVSHRSKIVNGVRVPRPGTENLFI